MFKDYEQQTFIYETLKEEEEHSQKMFEKGFYRVQTNNVILIDEKNNTKNALQVIYCKMGKSKYQIIVK